jgi:arsenate reductase
MAEVILRAHAGDRFEVFSAGTEPASEVFPPAVEAMREVGIDISHQKPKDIEGYLGRIHFEAVIIVCSKAEKECPSGFGSVRRLVWSFDDPTAAVGSDEEVLAICRRVRDEIDRRIREWLKEQNIDARPLMAADPE